MVIQKLFVVLFVLANLILPFVVQEIFPITTAPMFRDSPTAYCEFSVLDPNGQPLPLADFGLQRNYDGNPVGYGSGRLPSDTLDRFGSDDSENLVPHRDEVFEWVGSHMLKTDFDYVTVQVKVFGAVGKRIDVIDSWEIVVPNDPSKHTNRVAEQDSNINTTDSNADPASAVTKDSNEQAADD